LIQGELDVTQTGAGLNADGTYAANGTANYISGATSLSVADNLLDAQVKQNADDIASSVTDLTSEVTGVLPIANGGTNNGSLPVTNGGVIYTDGANLENTGIGLPGEVLISHGAGAPTWENQSTGFTGNSRQALGPNATRYAPITGTIIPTSPQTTACRNIVWRSGTIKNLYVEVSGNPGLANSVITILRNGVATVPALDVTLNGATSGQDLSDSFTVSAGDEISVRIVTAGGANSVYWSWAVEFSY